MHGLGDRERDWLEYAAVMHDLGVHISYEKHHRHSYYLVKHGDLRGFDPQEIEVMALVTRYHRQAVPKKSHDGYGALPGALRRTVRALSAILRLAEGLDRSHSQPLVGGGAARPRRRCARPAAHGGRRGARALGGAPRRDPVRADARQTGALRDPRNDTHMLNTLTRPHDYPGKLFVVEGVDGSGKTTQIGLLAKWLTAAGHRVRLLREYTALAREFKFHVIDARRRVDLIQEELRRKVEAFLASE